MKKRTLILFTLLVFGASVSLSAKSAAIVFTKGKVEVKIKNKWKKARIGMRLGQRDEIRTGKRSTALIKFKRGTRLKLRQNSQIALSRLSGSENITLNLRRGGVFSKVDKRRAGEKYRIRTPTSVAGVRGTEFFFSYGEKKKDALWLCVNEGKVNVKTDKSDVDVKEGFGVAIEDKAVSDPAALKWTQKLNWNMNADTGKIEDYTTIKEDYSVLDADYD